MKNTINEQQRQSRSNLLQIAHKFCIDRNRDINIINANKKIIMHDRNSIPECAKLQCKPKRLGDLLINLNKAVF